MEEATELLCYELDMEDSYGDGWRDNYFEIDGMSYTANGYGAEEMVCLEAGCYQVTVGGGGYQHEISWNFAGFSGGAPYDAQICFGDEVVVDGCDIENIYYLDM